MTPLLRPYFRLVLTATALCAVGACAAPQYENFQLTMLAESDDGYSLADVTIWHGERQLGTTTNSGRVDVAIEAVAGSEFSVRFDCPEGFEAARDKVLIPLRTTSYVAAVETKEDDDPSQDVEKQSTYSVTLECRPLRRQAMLVVRANMGNVPVKVGSELVGTTNAHGVAHIALTMPRREVFEVWLDTSQNDLISPANPEFPFVMPDHDEVFVLQETFTMRDPPAVEVVAKAKKKGKRSKPRPETRSRPTQINQGEEWGTLNK